MFFWGRAEIVFLFPIRRVRRLFYQRILSSAWAISWSAAIVGSWYRQPPDHRWGILVHRTYVGWVGVWLHFVSIKGSISWSSWRFSDLGRVLFVLVIDCDCFLTWGIAFLQNWFLNFLCRRLSRLIDYWLFGGRTLLFRRENRPLGVNILVYLFL